MVRKLKPYNRGPAAKTEKFKLPVGTEGPRGTSLLGNALMEEVFLEAQSAVVDRRERWRLWPSQEIVVMSHVRYDCTGVVAVGQMWEAFERKDSQHLMTD